MRQKTFLVFGILITALLLSCPVLSDEQVTEDQKEVIFVVQ